MGSIIRGIAFLLGYVLNFIYNLVNNYGLAIIIISVLFKLLMLPISVKQQASLKKNNEMQSKANEIQQKYANDQKRQSDELMKLYKEEGFNPFSGCLITILQMFLILGMFYLVSQPLTYMRQIDSTKIDNYYQELSANNEGQTIRYKEIAIIKAYSSTDPEVNINMNFLGLDLSDIPTENVSPDNWKAFIIPILYVISSFGTMKLMNLLNPQPKVLKDEKGEEDKDQQTLNDVNKTNQLIMPLMTVMIACIAPLGLALYWLVGNIFTLFEKLIMYKVESNKKEVVENGQK